MNDLMTKYFLSDMELQKQARIEKMDIEKGMQEPNEAYLSKLLEEVDAIKFNMEEIRNRVFEIQTLNEETESTHSAKLLIGLRHIMESDIDLVLRKVNVVRAHHECLDKIVSDYKEYRKRRYYNEIGEYPSEATIETMVSGSGQAFEGNKERHEAVMDIKRRLNELQKVLLHMGVLVEAHRLILDDNDGNVANSGSFVCSGTGTLFYAKQMRDKQNKKLECFIWSVVILIWLLFFIVVLPCF